MKNKFPLVILIAFLVFVSISGVFAEDIGYVVRTNADSNILDLINDSNYTYDIIKRNDIGSTNFSKYRILIVGEGNFVNDVWSIPVNEMNSILLNSYHLKDWNWTSSGTTSYSGNHPQEGFVFDGASKIVEGLNESFRIHEYGVSSYSESVIKKPYSKWAPGLKMIVADDLLNLENGGLVTSIKKNAELKNGEFTNARGVFIGFKDSNLWTSEAKQIFYNSLTWVKEGEDYDSDGFLGDVDCNDEDENINPDAEEIAYDGIDQNCDGFDLTDVDGDGFDAKEVGGTDCDDSSAEYNLNSTDLEKNCVNDAPKISNIFKIFVDEGENASLEIFAEDFEGDEINYSVNDSRFVQDGNLFSWQTNYSHGGEEFVNYEFMAFASDGNLTSQKSFEIMVKDKNKVPELISEIPEQVWHEDNNHTLNLSKYFYDFDGDKLDFLFYSTSQNNQIFLEKIEEGVAYFDVDENWYGEDWIIFNAKDNWINDVLTNNITLKVLPVNDEPKKLKDFEKVVMNENSNYVINLSEYFYDVDSNLNYYFDNPENITLDFDLDEQKLSIIPDEDWYGNRSLEIRATDGEYNTSKSELEVEVKEVVIPEVELTSPINNSFFNETRDIEFNFTAKDKISDSLNCELIIDGDSKDSLEIENNSIGNFEYSFSKDGKYFWKIECENDAQNSGISESRNLEISAPDNPVLQNAGDKKVNENEILEFEISATDLDNDELSFEVENLPSGANFEDNNDNTAKFSWKPDFSQEGEYKIKFIVEDETGLKDSLEIEIDVLGQPEFSDAKTCDLKDKNIEISIKDPDQEDEFELGELIEGEIEIENNFDEDLDFDYEIHLYDLEEEESIEDFEDDIDVDEGDSERLDFEIEIPTDLEDNNFAIYVVAEDEEDRCNSEYIEIDVVRKDHDVQIKDLEINPEILSVGDFAEVRVKIENLGSKDEDVYVILENKELGIMQESEEQEIEEFGDDDSENLEFEIEIPENATEKEYTLTATVFFDDGDERMQEKINFSVLNREDSDNSVQKTATTYPTINLEKLSDKKKNSNSINIGAKQTGESINEQKNEANLKFSKVEEENNNWIFWVLGFIVLGIIVLLAFIVRIFIQNK